ncbi:MAG: peptidoglycan D,D-transpeptidase FtsI family protein [Atopobiaceae bacterium]
MERHDRQNRSRTDGPERGRSSYDEVVQNRAERARRRQERAERERQSPERRRSGRKGRDKDGGGILSHVKGMDGRLVGIFCLLAVLGIIVCGRLFYLQIVEGPQLSQMAANSRTNEITLTAKRGTIYDRNGNVLAMSVDVKTIYSNPSQIEDKDQAAQIMADVLGGSKDDYLDIINQDTTFAYIKKKVDTTTASELEDKLDEADIAGIYFLDDSKRIYPYGSVAGQVLGMVGSDGQGLTGLELYYNDVLSGQDGSMIMETGADGTPIAGGVTEVTKATAGSDIVISIDANIQAKLEEILTEGAKKYEADSSSAMVTDPNTGEILATASTPLADLSDTSELTNEALNLRMVSDLYEPGSIFKILTMTSGLVNGTFGTDTVFSVPVQIQVGDDYVTDAITRYSTTDMTVSNILEESSNVGAILMARAVGAENFSAMVSALGIGHRTGIDYPGEVTGMVTDYDNYSSTTMSDMAFGQGLAIPQVQMVQAVGAIANGGSLMTPHFLIEKSGETMEWDSKGTVCTQDVTDQVSTVLESVIENGTAKHAAVEGYKVAAKTGTAQMTEDEEGYAEGKYISSLIGYANADDPQVLVYVGLNGTPYLAESSSAYMFSSIMSEALKDMGIKPVS